MNRLCTCTILASFILTGGCDSSFDPKGPFLDRLVVYSVLTPLNQSHVVRLSTTYDPPSFNPLEHTSSDQVTGALVSVRMDTTVVTFRDTVFPRNDIGRYADSVRAFVASPLTIARGKRYDLTVYSTAYGVLTATTFVPGNGDVSIDLESRFSLTSPNAGQSDISLFATPAPNAEGHIVRIFVEYELPSVSPGVLFTEEVPAEITDYRDCTTYTPAYPQVRRGELLGSRDRWRFRLVNYRRTLMKILKTHEGTAIQFKRIYVEHVQTDEHLYKYFSVVNGFQDVYSIRVDQPNYTNINGGLGVFGSFVSDTTVIASSFAPGFPNLTCSD